MLLNHLMQRWFSIPPHLHTKKFKYYSFLRFKLFSKTRFGSINVVESNELLFLDMLKTVSSYYERHQQYAVNENIMEYRGPQKFSDILDVEKRTYYGDGWYKYYRLTDMKEAITQNKGKDVMLQFEANPTTSLVDEELFENLLEQINTKITHNRKRGADKQREKLTPYAGPQCNEDRSILNKIRYDVNYRKRNFGEINDDQACESTSPRNELNENPSEMYLRQCSSCKEIRYLGKRAATKYHNTPYVYEDRVKTVQFQCSNLVNGICGEMDKDFIGVSFDEMQPGENYHGYTFEHTCISGLQLEILERHEDGSVDAKAISSFGCSDTPIHELKNHTFPLRKHSNSIATTGGRNRMGRVVKNDIHTVNLSLVKCLIETPREAKCCTPFLYGIPENPDNHAENETLNSTELKIVRNLHSVFNAVKILTCVKCGRTSPGLEEPKDHFIEIPVHGTMQHLNYDDPLYKILEQSEVINATELKIDPRFRHTQVYKSTEKSITSICQKCSQFYTIADDNTIKNISVNVNGGHIQKYNKWGPENMMTTNLFMHHPEPMIQNIAYEFQVFVKSMSMIEVMVCTPNLVHLTIVRSMSSLMPIQKHGTIAFPLITKWLDNQWTTNARPWTNFKTLPFITVSRTENDQVIEQARINMKNIYRFRDYATREVPLPFRSDGRTRTFSRFAGEGFSPFTEDQMNQLKASINTEEGPMKGVPFDLKKFTVEQLTERYKKPLTFPEFEHWLVNRDTIACHIWLEYLSMNEEEQSQETNKSVKGLWTLFVESVKDDTSVVIDETTDLESLMTIEVMANFVLKKNWLVTVLIEQEDSEKALDDLLCGIAAEFEFAASKYSNDEGGADITVGQVQSGTDGHPQDLLNEACLATCLDGLVVGPDKDAPVNEWSEGYFQKAFPTVFLSGDGDPYQLRHECIRENNENWKKEYLKWVSMQAEAQNYAQLQFVVHNISKRLEANQAANLIIKDTKITDNLPPKGEFLKRVGEATKVSNTVMQHKALITDSPSWWQQQVNKEIGVVRHLESVELRKEEKKYPVLASHFTTSALPWFDSPSIHNLIPNESIVATNESDIQQLEKQQRKSNVLTHPHVVDYMTSLIGELQIKYFSLNRHQSQYFVLRNEWGSNSNPHFHCLLYSKNLGQLVTDLETELQEYFNTLISEGNARMEIERKTVEKWKEGQEKIINFFKGQYSNWNPGKTSTGVDTYNYKDDGDFSISKLNMAREIDIALSTGNFTKLDDIFVKICHRSLCHLSHSGKNGRPTKANYCYKPVRKVNKAKTAERRKLNETAPKVYSTYAGCKRRKPQPIRHKAEIYKDPHDKKKIQLSFPCNDGFFNGCDEMKVLTVLGNSDDKALVPPSFMRPPKIKWEKGILSLELFTSNGVDHIEYILKYMLKDPVPPKTNVQLMTLGMETLTDNDPIDGRTIRRAYQKVATLQSVTLLNANHVNKDLPLVIRNTRSFDVNVKGALTLKQNYNENLHGEFGYCSSKIKQFDGRFECINQNLAQHFQQNGISMREYFEKYNVYPRYVNHEQKYHLTSRRLIDPQNQIYCATRSTPHLSLSSVNPRSRHYSDTCKHIVLYYKTFYGRISEEIPIFEDEEQEVQYWIEELQLNFPEWNGFPDPFMKRMLNFYTNPPVNDDSDELYASDSDELVE